MTAESGTVISVDLRVGGQGWREAWSGAARREDCTLTVPYLPVRGHEFSLRIRGKGRATLHAINRRYREGSAR